MKIEEVVNEVLVLEDMTSTEITVCTNVDSYVCDLEFMGQKGFYGTAIDEILSEAAQDGEGLLSPVYQEFGEYYVEELMTDTLNEICLRKSYSAKTPELSFVGYKSPKYYNFRTDEVVIGTNDINAIYYVLKGDDFDAYIKEVTTAQDGYIPFYKAEDFDKSITLWDKTQKSLVLSYLAHLMDGACDLDLDRVFDIVQECKQKPRLKNEIKNGVGRVWYEPSIGDVSSLEENFNTIDTNKFIGIGVKDAREVYIASVSNVLQTINEIGFKIDVTIDRENGPEWYKRYEEVAIKIMHKMFPDEELEYSMDLIRFLEEYENSLNAN